MTEPTGRCVSCHPYFGRCRKDEGHPGDHHSATATASCDWLDGRSEVRPSGGMTETEMAAWQVYVSSPPHTTKNSSDFVAGFRAHAATITVGVDA